MTPDPFVYQYAIGGVVFLAGMLVAWRHGYVGLTGHRRRNLVLMVSGLAFFMVLQGWLQHGPMEEAEPGPPATARDADGQAAGLGHPLDHAVMAAYLAVILAVGLAFGRRLKTTRDFFFGGQRFSWWFIAASLVATLVGSYSFVKYGQAAYRYGLASSQSYLNDWALMPFLLFGWLPILYFSRVTSVPEYFGRRFGPRVRLAATISVLIYLISYVGVNLYTMGTVLNALVGWPVLLAAAGVASVSALYVTLGGQTSVIVTDLFQGVMLLGAGLVILGLGIHAAGGLESAWLHLPREHRLAFNNFNTDPSFPSVGIFWQDAMANSAFFYFLNQGILMRFMASRSVREARKAALAMGLVLMPVAACVVASGGWVGRSLVHAGVLPEMDARTAFYVTAEFLARPGLFGLLLAALTAALMSTIDTLITAVSAVAVNDVYRVHVHREADDKELLRVARLCAVGVTLLGVTLVPVYAQFGTIYAAHGAMTAAVTPPLVVALFLAVFWRRYTRTAALWTIVGGLAAIVVSVFVPEVIAPFAHGVPMVDAGEGLFAGAKQYKFMRALYGLVVSAAIGVAVSLVTKPESEERRRGLVWGTVQDAIRRYKGASGEEHEPSVALARVARGDAEAPPTGEAALPTVDLSPRLAELLGARPGDLVHVGDRRWWLGGLRSSQAVVGAVDAAAEDALVVVGPVTFDAVVASGRREEAVRVELIC